MKRRHIVCGILSISLIGLLIDFATVVRAAPVDTGEASPMAATETEAASTSLTVCNLPYARVKRSSPAVGDLDNDGVKEIVVGGSDGYLYAVNPEDCSAVPGWPKQVNDYFIPPVVQQKSPTQDIESSPVVADIDGDGHPEVIATVGWMPQYHQNGGAIVFEHDGTVKPGWPRATLDVHGGGGPPYWDPDGYADGVFSTPAIGDVDGDGGLEIVYGGFDKCIYAWNDDGTPVDNWWNVAKNEPARCIPDTIWSSPALADLDGDHVLDIVIGTDSHPEYAGGSVWALKGDNTILWVVYTTQTMSSSPAVGDINDDGYPEIVIGTGGHYPQGYKGITDGYKVYAFDRFGNNLPGWPRPTAGNMPASPSLADLDDDGTLEIMIGCGMEVHFDPDNPPAGFCNQMYAWHHDGTAVSGYPTTITRATPWPAGRSPAGMPYGPILTDCNDDGKVDAFLVEAGGWGVSVFAWDNPGGADGATYNTNNTLQAPPVIDNLYGNNNLYMVAASASDVSGSQGAIYIWNLSGSADGARPWPMFRRNAQRTGHYLMPAHLDAAPDSIYAMHQIGQSGPEHATVWLQNLGEADFNWTVTDNHSRVTLSPSSGTFPAQDHVGVTISTSGLPTGEHSLGQITISASANGEPIAGSPIYIPVTVYVGEVHQVFLPLTVHH